LNYNRDTDFYSDGDRDYDLYLFFARVRYLAFRAREKEMQKLGITPEQSQVLFISHVMNGQSTPAEIARLYLLKRHTVSSMVDRMEKKGLITKVKDLKNKNMIRVTMTEKGHKIYKLTTERAAIHKVMGALNDQERAQFLHCLQKIQSKASKELGMKKKALSLRARIPKIALESTSEK